LLGDEGSGYFIAIEALKELALEEDLDLKPSDLSKALIRKLGVINRQDIKEFVYTSLKGDIAALVPVIVKCAEEGEKSAIEILRRSGEQLAMATLRVYKGLNFKDAVSVGVKGSILTKVTIVRNEFEKVLRENINEVRIIDEDFPPALGAYFLALKELKTKEI